MGHAETSILVGGTALGEGLEAPLYLGLRQGAHGLVHDAAVLIEVEGRYPAYVVPRRGLRGVVHVYLGEFHLSREILSQFIQNRFEPAAVASPEGGEIDEHRAAEARHFPLEGCVGDLDGPVGIETREVEGLLALATPGPVCPPAPRNAVLRAALGTRNDDRLAAHDTIHPSLENFSTENVSIAGCPLQGPDS